VAIKEAQLWHAQSATFRITLASCQLR